MSWNGSSKYRTLFFVVEHGLLHSTYAGVAGERLRYCISMETRAVRGEYTTKGMGNYLVLYEHNRFSGEQYTSFEQFTIYFR